MPALGVVLGVEVLAAVLLRGLAGAGALGPGPIRFARGLLSEPVPGVGRRIGRGALRQTTTAGRVVLGPIRAPAPRCRRDRTGTGASGRIEAARRLVFAETVTGLGSGPVQYAGVLICGAIYGIDRTRSAGVAWCPAVTSCGIEWAGPAPGAEVGRCVRSGTSGEVLGLTGPRLGFGSTPIAGAVCGITGPRALRVGPPTRPPLGCTSAGTRPDPACAGTGARYRGRRRPVRSGGIPAAVSLRCRIGPRGPGPAGLGGLRPAGPLRRPPRPAQRAEDPGETAYSPRRGRSAGRREGRAGLARHRYAGATRGIGIVQRKRPGRRRGRSGVAGVGFAMAVWHVRRGVAVETWMPLGWR